MGKTYEHLTLEDRCRLLGMLEMGLPKAEIARRLGRDRSTVYREIARNRCVGSYRPDSAARRVRAIAKRPTRCRGTLNAYS